MSRTLGLGVNKVNNVPLTKSSNVDDNVEIIDVQEIVATDQFPRTSEGPSN